MCPLDPFLLAQSHIAMYTVYVTIHMVHGCSAHSIVNRINAERELASDNNNKKIDTIISS